MQPIYYAMNSFTARVTFTPVEDWTGSGCRVVNQSELSWIILQQTKLDCNVTE